MGNSRSDFEQTYQEFLVYEVGRGEVRRAPEHVRLTLAGGDGTQYSDAQLDDYHADGMLRWRAETRLRVRARFSHPQAELVGTAGFGFWNDPFGMTKIGNGARGWPRFRLPQALWFFFASPPSNMALATGLPGYGWKAATIDAGGWVAKALLPFAPLGMLACRVPFMYRRLWPVAQRVLKVEEALLPVAMDVWHEYELVWYAHQARFLVDGQVMLETRVAPRGPLGFVAWIDNQFMVVTPQGEVRGGMVAHGEQWLEIGELRVTAG